VDLLQNGQTIDHRYRDTAAAGYQGYGEMQADTGVIQAEYPKKQMPGERRASRSCSKADHLVLCWAAGRLPKTEMCIRFGSSVLGLNWY